MTSTIGERISELLRQNNLTQRELASKVGVTEVSMSRYINGDRTPRTAVLAKMAEVLHTTSDYILGHEADADPELSYYEVQRTVARNACNWTHKQKVDLVSALFEQ